MAQNVVPKRETNLDLDIDLTNDLPTPSRSRVITPSRPMTGDPAETRALPRRRGFLGTLDSFLIVVVVLLLSIGALMVYSTTFDWSAYDFGSETFIFMQHMRNMLIGGVLLILLAAIDYRVWKRFAVVLLLFTVGSLIAVLVFSDQVFGARRSFLNGSYQPGELAELVIVLYMAAWLGSKRAKVAGLFTGLVPFGLLLGFIGALIMLQPDLSTAATIFLVAGMMYFLAGANITYLVAILGVLGVGAYIVSQRLSYAQDRLSGFTAGLVECGQDCYHAQQAVIAFINGGWSGVGLGQGQQKFGFLPAPHTDSIFAVIGEELGVFGAAFLVGLFIVFVFRGLYISRRAPDAFGALLAAGITLWIITKALFNIAVMLSLVPPTGVAMPFVSFGGSSLVTVMAGTGLLLSVARVTLRQNAPEGRGIGANDDRGWGNRWSRVSGFGGGRSRSSASAQR